MNDKVPMLEEGYRALEAELKNLKGVERPAVVQAIEEARAHGDLSENAEYHAAKEKQGHIEGRIMELEGKISRAQVIDPTSLNSETIVFGATVTMLDEDDEEVVYQIVGADEGDVKVGRISYQSPIARALIGKRVEDEVEVRAPGGERYYEITKIEFK
ncbi:MAG: transcription elongation factor GreA [Kordiimonadaceae bacterium]|nr:transcription elongation factor GreA [Kordiimonadaceae bacterium]MBO6569362.1 transcription elongation factor GreA [Kordiimonadaceae bacterium]MBO6964837.1 transcription elongation factor GreA [Kordiimonadaceae bacterium]